VYVAVDDNVLVKVNVKVEEGFAARLPDAA
jgi:hypothetical protein